MWSITIEVAIVDHVNDGPWRFLHGGPFFTAHLQDVRLVLFCHIGIT